MTDINLFLNKDLKADDVLHSNALGAVAGGGAAGGMSLEKRRQLLNQPRVIGAYEHSAKLGRLGSSLKARTYKQQARIYDASKDSFQDEASLGNRQQGGIKDRDKIDTQSLARRQQFTEPRGRNYDKFA